MSASNGPIEVFNRYSGQVEQEQVFGEGWLRWTYQSLGGRVLLGLLIKRAVFSRWFGWRMDRPASAVKIGPFIEQYRIASDEFEAPAGGFRTFNEFFYRRLKPGARPIAPDPEVVVFPADGRHLALPDVGAADQIYAKGQHLTVAELLGDAELGRRFEHGTLVISRLCPVDYHRFHFPCDGMAGAGRLLPGPLYSVNPIAVRRSLDHLVRNKRLVTPLHTPSCGLVVMVELGATCVGSIVTTASEGVVRKGDEKGYFRFGGSCVMTLFEPGRIRLSDDLRAQAAGGRELYARMGDEMGRIAVR